MDWLNLDTWLVVFISVFFSGMALAAWWVLKQAGNNQQKQTDWELRKDWLMKSYDEEMTKQALVELAEEIHHVNQKWWEDLDTGQPLSRNVGELLMLTVSELAEAMEGHRKSLMDDHLPNRPMFEVELADCIIRCLDIGAGLKFDVAGALVEKLQYNRTRPDHKVENRKLAGGKKY